MAPRKRSSDHLFAHLAAAQEISLLAAVTVLEEEVHADGQHEHQINDKYDHFADFHCFFLLQDKLHQQSGV